MLDDRLLEAIDQVVRAALEEDQADRDITTLAIIPPEAQGVARLVARQTCILAGVSAFTAVFNHIGGVKVEFSASNGDQVHGTVAHLSGSLRTLLTGERTALNLVQHLSGIATQTQSFVARAGGVEVRDTRKTTPGLRLLEKAAVAAGGGTNHRMSLADAFLIKDNHVAVAGGIRPAVEAARASVRGAWVEVECDTLEQVAEALEAKADEILLDNMSINELDQAVKLIGDRARTEASGGVTLETIDAIAATGVNAVSVGALTHSAPAIDFSLEVIPGEN